MSKRADYTQWSNDQLVARVLALELQLKENSAKNLSPPSTSPPPEAPKKPRALRAFDPSKYSTRLIALKFAYVGQRYNGLEYHAKNDTPLPTIEEELWKALSKARLIFPTPNLEIGEEEVNWEGCEYSKCGRTDKGVSAFGQVVGIRVRSNRPRSRRQSSQETAHTLEGTDARIADSVETGALPPTSNQGSSSDGTPTPTSSIAPSDETFPFHPINDELPYCQILNRLLPPDIRILAWCPNPPANFSARFSCKERRYRYFFTQPAFTPTPTPTPNFPEPSLHREGWLDIAAMRLAAKKFEGLHDFRNFCKLDPSKQIENFERRIFHADIVRLDPTQSPASFVSLPQFQQEVQQRTNSTPSDLPHTKTNNEPDDNDAASSIRTTSPALYAFTLHGSAFLWHQVRHMIAILFLIGQGLEAPSLIDTLLDPTLTPRKPQYEMASDAPLVLWDCVFPAEGGEGGAEDALEWVYVGDAGEGKTAAAAAAGGGGGGGGGGSGGAAKDEKYGSNGVVPELWKLWRARKMEEVLAGSLLDVVVRQGSDQPDHLRHHTPISSSQSTHLPPAKDSRKAIPAPKSQKIFQGGDCARLVGKYVPVMQKPRNEAPAVVNERYARKKGGERKGGSEMSR